MANPNEGEMPCPLCKKQAFIRRAVKGSRKYYIHCPNGCGNIQPNGPTGQEFILKHPLYGVKEPTPKPTNHPSEKPGSNPGPAPAGEQGAAPGGAAPAAKKTRAPVQPPDPPAADKKPQAEQPKKSRGLGIFG